MRRIDQITPVDENSSKMAWEKIDQLTKPIGSLGKIEEYAAQLAAISGKMSQALEKSAVCVFAADNGVYDSQITLVPQEVTTTQLENMAKGLAGINAMCALSRSDLFLIDVGVKRPPASDNIEDRCVMRGTDNMEFGPAMSRQQAQKAVEVGLDKACELADRGYELLGAGEMGICNTSTSAAVISVLLDLPLEAVVDRGAGIDDAHFQRKCEVIQSAIELNKPNREDVLDVLSKVGGLDICAMCGFYLGAAYRKLPVVVDGFIASAAALCAVRLNPLAKDYLFGSHRSTEKGQSPALEAIGIEAPLHLNMRLGEGTGCPLMFELLRASQNIMRSMGSFDQGNIDSSEFVDLRKIK